MTLTAGQQMAMNSNANVNQSVFGTILINVKAYGAKGTGAIDDTTFIQAAIDYARSIGMHEVFFPAGTYLYGTLNNTDGIVFIGDGVILNGNTKINLTSINVLDKHANFEDITLKFINKTAVKVICLGDSITEGAGLTGGQKPYPQVLQERLQYIYDNPNITVINKGFGGWSTILGLASFKSLVLDLTPDVVIIMYGINDCRNNISVELYRANLKAMVALCKLNNIKVVLMSPTPIANELNGAGVKDNIDRKLTTFAKSVKDVAYENKVDFIDMYGEWLNLLKRNAINMHILVDTIHPDETGYKYIADIVMAKLLCLNFGSEFEVNEYLPFNSPMVKKNVTGIVYEVAGKLAYFYKINIIIPGEYVRFLIYNNDPLQSLSLLVYQDTNTRSFKVRNFGSVYATVGGATSPNFNTELPITLGVGLHCFDIKSEDTTSDWVYLSGCQLVIV